MKILTLSILVLMSSPLRSESLYYDSSYSESLDDDSSYPNSIFLDPDTDAGRNRLLELEEFLEKNPEELITNCFSDRYESKDKNKKDSSEEENFVGEALH